MTDLESEHASGIFIWKLLIVIYCEKDEEKVSRILDVICGKGPQKMD